jgi:WD40 repeat protein
MQLQDRRYWCFISYSHRDNQEVGRQWATWLHQQLETYEVPNDLVGTTNVCGEVIPTRIFPVFRDEEELEPGDLNQKIYRALERSNVLIVIGSPRARGSMYVSNEIRYFKQIGKSDRIFAAIVDGEPGAAAAANGCFPDALFYRVDDRGQIDTATRIEPMAADFRLKDGTQGWTNPEAYREQMAEGRHLSKSEIARRAAAYRDRLNRSTLQLVASVLGVPFGTLQQRDQAYQLAVSRRKATVLQRWLAAVATLTIAAVGAAYYANVQREEAVQRALIATSSALSFRSRNVLDEQADLGLLLAAESYKTFDTYEARFALLSAIQRRPNLQVIAHIDKGAVTAVTESHDGRIVAAASQDGSVSFFSAATLAPLGLALQAHAQSIRSALYSPTANVLVTAANDEIRFWDADRREPLSAPLGAGLGEVSMVAFSRDGKLLASAHADGIALWDVRSQRVVSKLDDSQNTSSLALSSDGTLLAAGDYGAKVRVWNLAEGGRLISEPFDTPQRFVTSLAFSADGHVLAVGGSSPDITLWDLRTRQHVRKPLATPSGSTFVTFDEATQQIAAGDGAGVVSVWKPLSSLSPLNPGVQTLKAHRGSVKSLVFDPGGRFIFSGGSDGKLIKWRIDDSNPLGQSILEEGGEIASAHRTDLLAIARNDGRIVLWDLSCASVLSVMGTVRDKSDALIAFSQDDKLLAAVDPTGLAIWSLDEGRLLKWPRHQDERTLLRNIAFTREGRLVICSQGFLDKTLKHSELRVSTIDATTGQEAGPPLRIPLESQTSATSVSSDGDLLAVATGAHVALWRLDSAQAQGPPIEAGSDVSVLRFSQNGGAIAIGTRDCRIRIWDIRAAKVLGDLRRGHTAHIDNIVFSDRLLVSSGYSQNRALGPQKDVFLWDLLAMQQVGQLLQGRQLADQHIYLALGRSGTTLVTSGSDGGHVWSWDLDPASWRAASLRTANRTLTGDDQ